MAAKTPETVTARVLVDLKAFDAKVDQVVTLLWRDAKALIADHSIDPHKDAVAHARTLGLGEVDATGAAPAEQTESDKNEDPIPTTGGDLVEWLQRHKPADAPEEGWPDPKLTVPQLKKLAETIAAAEAEAGQGDE